MEGSQFVEERHSIVDSLVKMASSPLCAANPPGLVRVVFLAVTPGCFLAVSPGCFLAVSQVCY